MPPKRNVAFIKPDEPAFLKRMKAQIGWQEPDTIDAKRESIENNSDESDDDIEKDDERPQVVQLKEGDLTAEEVLKLEKDEAEKPADLSQRVIFKPNKKKKDDDKKDKSSNDESSNSKSKKDKKKSTKNLLSFQEDDEEDS